MNSLLASHGMRTLLRRTLFLPLMPLIVAYAGAQLSSTPIVMIDGLSNSLPQVRAAFADDVILTTAVGMGGGGNDPATASVDFQHETAAMWSYAYYSPSKTQIFMAHVTKVDTGYAIILPGPTAAAGTETALDLNQPYAPLSALPARLAADAVYSRYGNDHPTLTPMFAILGNGGIPDPLAEPLPAWFPRDQLNWQLGYSSMTGDQLNCVVAAVTGEVFCLRQTPAGVRCADAGRESAASLTASPNPAPERVRIDVRLRSDGTSGRLREIALFDAEGNRVRDLSPEQRNDGASFVEIGTRELPPGLYICRVAGEGWSESIGVMVER